MVLTIASVERRCHLCRGRPPQQLRPGWPRNDVEQRCLWPHPVVHQLLTRRSTASQDAPSRPPTSQASPTTNVVAICALRSQAPPSLPLAPPRHQPHQSHHQCRSLSRLRICRPPCHPPRRPPCLFGFTTARSSLSTNSSLPQLILIPINRTIYAFSHASRRRIYEVMSRDNTSVHGEAQQLLRRGMAARMCATARALPSLYLHLIQYRLTPLRPSLRATTTRSIDATPRLLMLSALRLSTYKESAHRQGRDVTMRGGVKESMPMLSAAQEKLGQTSASAVHDTVRRWCSASWEKRCRTYRRAAARAARTHAMVTSDAASRTNFSLPSPAVLLAVDYCKGRGQGVSFFNRAAIATQPTYPIVGLSLLVAVAAVGWRGARPEGSRDLRRRSSSSPLPPDPRHRDRPCARRALS